MSDSGKTTAEEMKEMLGLFSEKVPALLNSLTDVLYGKASAEKYGQAVSNFYRTLKDSGMTDDQAFRLTEQYMSSLNLGKIISGVVGSSKAHRRSEDGSDDDRRGLKVVVKGKKDDDDF